MTSIELEIHERSKRFHAEIARRASLVPQKRNLSYSVPSTPFGVLKANPVRWVPPNIEPSYWHCMWFADLIEIPAPKPTGPPSIDLIQQIVARKFNLSKTMLLSERRTHNIVVPRQIGMYLAKMLTLRSLPEIGRRFGNKDHTTVLYAVRKIAARCVSDAIFAGEVAELKAELRR